ncbi:hypothetical protein GCK32_006265 [Trichostrongylus colubriformis]|uniref:Uncharacterized protein n=1 Tax=Trichostrongylus colubriformis TaxID=6319 RepID=A0AAN8GDC7_TRICO
MSSWSNKPDPKDQMRENNKNVRRANRDLESDRRALERREKELVCCTRETARPTTQAEGETCWNELQIHEHWCSEQLAAVPKVPTSVGADSKPMSDKNIENMLAQLRG